MLRRCIVAYIAIVRLKVMEDENIFTSGVEKLLNCKYLVSVKVQMQRRKNKLVPTTKQSRSEHWIHVIVLKDIALCRYMSLYQSIVLSNVHWVTNYNVYFEKMNFNKAFMFMLFFSNLLCRKQLRDFNSLLGRRVYSISIPNARLYKINI